MDKFFLFASRRCGTRYELTGLDKDCKVAGYIVVNYIENGRIKVILEEYLWKQLYIKNMAPPMFLN